MTETLANGYSSESTQRELSNEYQHDRVKMIFKNLCILVVLTKVALALEGLKANRAFNPHHTNTSLSSRRALPWKLRNGHGNHAVTFLFQYSPSDEIQSEESAYTYTHKIC